MVKVISIAALATLIIFSYQNCAVYQSEGREQLNQFLSGSQNGCLPFLDINDVADMTGYSTNDIILRKTSDALGNFGCTITDRSRSTDRSAIECQVGEDQKNMAQLSYDPTPPTSFDDIYATYCPAGNFLCEDVLNGVRAGIHGILIATPTGGIDFLAYFKLNVTPEGRFSSVSTSEGYNYSGFGYARFVDTSTSVSVFVTDDNRGVECQLSFPRRVSDTELSLLSARQEDYDQVVVEVGSSPSDLEKLKNLGIRILSNY